MKYTEREGLMAKEMTFHIITIAKIVVRNEYIWPISHFLAFYCFLSYLHYGKKNHNNLALTFKAAIVFVEFRSQNFITF